MPDGCVVGHDCDALLDVREGLDIKKLLGLREGMNKLLALGRDLCI